MRIFRRGTRRPRSARNVSVTQLLVRRDVPPAVVDAAEPADATPSRPEVLEELSAAAQQALEELSSPIL